MATVAERRQKIESILNKIIKETKSSYKDDYEYENQTTRTQSLLWRDGLTR